MKIYFEIEVKGAAINEVTALIARAIQIKGVQSYLEYGTMAKDLTSMNGRDPHINPQPEDVLRTGPKYDHSYIEVLDHDPRYASTDVSFFDVARGRERVCSIDQWREQMKDAEILKLGATNEE